MPIFLNIRSSYPEVSCKNGVLKTKFLQNSLKNICDAVFNLIKFQAKGLFRGFSYENSFPVAFPLSREKHYLLAFIYEIFPRLSKIYFGWLLWGEGDFARNQYWKWVTQTWRKMAQFCCIWNLSSLLHNLTYLLLLNSFLFLCTSVFLKSLNSYFLRWLAYKSLLSRSSVLINYTLWFSNLFYASGCFQLFWWSKFFRVQGF